MLESNSVNCEDRSKNLRRNAWVNLQPYTV